MNLGIFKDKLVRYVSKKSLSREKDGRAAYDGD